MFSAFVAHVFNAKNFCGPVYRGWKCAVVVWMPYLVYVCMYMCVSTVHIIVGVPNGVWRADGGRVRGVEKGERRTWYVCPA